MPNSRFNSRERVSSFDRDLVKVFCDENGSQSRAHDRRPQSNINLPPRSVKNLVKKAVTPDDPQEVSESKHEGAEAAIFNETLKLSLKPACFFSTALSSAKAAKPSVEQCAAVLDSKEQQRRHERTKTLPTQLSRLAASNYAHSAHRSYKGKSVLLNGMSSPVPIERCS